MRWIFLSLLTALSGLLSACSSAGLTNINYAYQPQGVQLVVSAPPTLNAYDGQAHALLLGVIQTDQLDPLYPLLTSNDGFVNLLSNRDNKYVLQRIFIQPDDHRIIAFDRNAKTQALVFLAGYATLLPAQSSVIVKIPVEENHGGFLWLDKTYRVKMVYVYLDLGPQGIIRTRACDQPLSVSETCNQDLIASAG